MDDKQNQQNQSYFNAEILQQAGIGPIEMIEPPKKNKKTLMLAVVAIFGLVIFGSVLAVLLLTDKNADKTIDVADVPAANKETVDSILDLAASNDFADVKNKHVSSLSPLASGATDEGLVSPYVGDDINWALCSRPMGDVKPTAQHKDSDGKVYDVAYVAAECETESGGKKVVSMDIRRPAGYEGSDGGWKLYFLVLRSHTNG